MDEVTQQNAALVEEAAAAAESMQEQVGSLVQSVAHFKLGQSGPGAASAAHRNLSQQTNVTRFPSKSIKPQLRTIR